jgi:hypothetical protein
MKRALVVTFCILMLGSLFLLNTGTIKASEPGYERVEHANGYAKTYDGAWTPSNEWEDGLETVLATNVTCRSTYTVVSFDPMLVTTNTIIEILDDNTTDTGDYWQIIFDGQLNGGTTPQTDDYRIEIVGHTTLMLYQGNGTGWSQITPVAGEITWANSTSASPTNSKPHWILEISVSKSGSIALTIIPGVRYAVYDESNGAAGVRAWPPTARDVPNGWGVLNYSDVVIPEGFSLGVVVLLSSVAVLVGFFWFRKRSKIDNCSSAKLSK